MVTISRILQDHRNAGAISELIALWGFVDEHTFLTKAGAVGLVYRLDGVDDECLDHRDRAAVAQRYEQALRQLDASFRIYQYVIKRPVPPFAAESHEQPVVHEALARRTTYLNDQASTLFEIDLYLVVLHEPSSTRSWSRLSLPTAFSRSKTSQGLVTEIDRAVLALQQKAQAFAILLEDTAHPTLLGKDDAFRFFRQLVNYAPHKTDAVTRKYDTHLDFYVADSAVDCHRDHLLVDDWRVRVLTMKDAPAKTFAHMLRDLADLPTSLTVCLEWQRIPNAMMRRDLHTRRRHFFNKKVSLVNYLSSQTKPEEMLVDDSATATVSELGQALTELEVHGRLFGACSLTVVLHDREAAMLDRMVGECAKVFAAHDGSLYDETYNLLNAWLAIVPGNGAHNLRRLALLNSTVADLSLLFRPKTGTRTSAHLGGRPCLAVFETDHYAAYHWNLHVDDVGHTLVQGATGSGKSFLVNFLMTHAQKYDPFTVIFDLGGSYEKLTRLLGGSTWQIGLTHRDFTINPFCLEPTPAHLHFLFSFVRVLLQSSDQYRLSLSDDREVYEAVQNVYCLEPAQRRLLTLANMLPRALAQHLHRWIQGGPYAAFFDNVEDTLTFQRLQCFDFEGLEQFPLVLEPLLFYILHRASTTIQDRASDDTLKLFVLDEAWRFARDATVKAYITEALKTWRKRNAAMVLATQSSDDFIDGDLLRTVVENCPTKFFLANPGMDLARARELFHLNETEAALIAQLRPRQQMLIKRPDVAKVVNLRVDPHSYWIYTNTPLDNARLAQLRQHDGLRAAIDRLSVCE